MLTPGSPRAGGHWLWWWRRHLYCPASATSLAAAAAASSSRSNQDIIHEQRTTTVRHVVGRSLVSHCAAVILLSFVALAHNTNTSLTLEESLCATSSSDRLVVAIIFIF